MDAMKRERVALGLDPPPPFSLRSLLSDVVIVVAFAVAMTGYWLVLWALDAVQWLRGR